jgi:hypothetical protein
METHTCNSLPKGVPIPKQRHALASCREQSPMLYAKMLSARTGSLQSSRWCSWTCLLSVAFDNLITGSLYCTVSDSHIDSYTGAMKVCCCASGGRGGGGQSR